jgi:hypothetical protein
MRWLRTKARIGAWCALLALAIQFTLSFGHAHRVEISWPFGGSLQFTLADHARSEAIPDAPAWPVNPAAPAFDFCAICAVTHLAGNTVPAAAPELPVPIVIHPIGIWPRTDTASVAWSYRLFRARAPPLV